MAAKPPFRSIQVNGVAILTPRPVVNFSGSGLSYADDPDNRRMVLAFTSGAGPEFNIYDYGATGDGTTNDAPAIQLAFNAAAAAGGGTILIPPRRQNGSRARYAWKTAVSIDAQPGGAGPPAIFELAGWGSEVLVTTASAPYVALTCQQKLLVRGIRWYGTLDLANPTTQPLPISGLINAPVHLHAEDCTFNGFMIDRPGTEFATQTNNSILYSTSLYVSRCYFASVGGSGRVVVLARDYYDVRVQDCWFTDFFTYNGVTMATSGGGEYPYSSIGAITPAVDTEESHFSASSVTIDNVRIDEGTGGLGEQVLIWRGFGGITRKCPFVRIRGLSSMVAQTSGAFGLRLDGVRKAVVEDWFVFGGAAGGALYADVVDELTLRRTFTGTGVYGIAQDKVTITSNVGLVRAEDCHLNLTTGNSAVQTIIESSTKPRGLFNFTNATRPAANTVRAGTVIWNTQTSQVQVSDGASWLVVGP